MLTRPTLTRPSLSRRHFLAASAATVSAGLALPQAAFAAVPTLTVASRQLEVLGRGVNRDGPNGPSYLWPGSAPDDQSAF